jgi:predicted DNA-binding transcriptional regulator YafY
MPKRGENYGQFLDLLELTMWLTESASGVSLAEIAGRFGVTRRTAERMRDALANYFGGDFEERREGPQKYFKLRSRRLDPVTLASITEEELAAFPTAVQALRRSNLAAPAEALERAGVKLRSLLKMKAAKAADLEELLKFEGLALRPGPRLKYDEAVVGILREALRSFRQVKITYLGSQGRPWDSVLIPLGFLYGERQHYLVARYADGRLAGQIRHFALSRIQGVEKLAADFEEDPGFDLAAHAARSFGAFQEEPFEVEWLFSPAVAAEAENYLFHPSQEMSRRPDGGLLVRFTAGGRLEMAWHLYTWGREVKVLKPADFWETLPEL